jgi:hypothetical protein
MTKAQRMIEQLEILSNQIREQDKELAKYKGAIDDDSPFGRLARAVKELRNE